MKGNSHAPFWSSGRRSDPPIDCDGTRPDIHLQHKPAGPGRERNLRMPVDHDHIVHIRPSIAVLAKKQR